MLRKDAAHHASEACAYWHRWCKHCGDIFMAGDLREHAGSCPEERIKCPNPWTDDAGCPFSFPRRSLAEHRGSCESEEVQCPCPGCEEWMTRAAVEEHVEASGWVHRRLIWGRMNDSVQVNPKL